MAASKEPAKSGASLRRTLRVLEHALNRAPQPEPRVIADELKLPLPTVRWLIRALAEAGLIARSSDGGVSGPGPLMFHLAALVYANPQIEGIARATMRSLVEALNEAATFNLYRPWNAQAICVAVEECDRAFQYPLQLGDARPLDLGAYGHAILAFLPDDAQNAVLTAAASNPRARKALLKSLRQVKDRGVSITHGACIDDATEIAAPVFDAHGMVVGSLAATIPRGRCPPEREETAAEVVLSSARKLSAEFGARMPAGQPMERSRPDA